MNTSLHVEKAAAIRVQMERTIRPYGGTDQKALDALQARYDALVAEDAKRLTADELKAEVRALPQNPYPWAKHNYLCRVHSTVLRNAR